MKKTGMILLILLMLTGISGCSGKERLLDPSDPVTISIWHVYGNQTESPFNDSLDLFNQTVGKEQGIIVSVGSIIDSASIDAALIASAKGEPGAADLPDLFTAYPRVAQDIGEDRLLDWNTLFSEEELGIFVEDFLTEGQINGRQLTLPIAKSTEVLFVNRTLFDRFCAETGVTMENFSTFEGLFAACDRYYAWSGGKTLFQYDDLYNYFLINVAALGGELVKDGKLDCTSEAFIQVYAPAARSAIYGGLSLYENYSTDRWASGDVIAFIASSAGILYARDEVTYADNTSEKITMEILPYPVFEAAAPTVMQRGVTLFAVKPEDERKAAAIRTFVQWLTETPNNLDFVTKAGYIPGTGAALRTLFADTGAVENERYRMLYEAVSQMYGGYAFRALPVYEDSGNVQREFSRFFQRTLNEAHEQYLERVLAGEDENAVLEELLHVSLKQIQERF